MMLKKLLFTNLLFAFTLFVSAQTRSNELPPGKFPEDMERNYDELLSKWAKNAKYAESCSILSDDNVSYPDSVYIKRLYSLPTQIEVVYNQSVKNFIERYAGRMRRQVSYMLGEGKYYFPMFEEALEREGIPMELKYLAVIESALNPIARSRMGATGLWQFMPATGKMYDLEINSLVDERCDPHKSTTAAARYLKDLYSIFNDWNLAIAAYNCGPGNVNKAIRRSGGQTDFWTIYPYLPRETRDYVPIFIAATYIMNYHKEHNICPVECDKPASMDTVVVNKNLHFQQIADVLNIPIDDVRRYNPQFRNNIIPGEYKGYALNLPIHKISAFIDNSDTIFAYKVNELFTHRKVAGQTLANTSTSYRVKRGDTLSKIAKRYGISVTQLKRLNGLKSNSVSVGRYLVVSAPVSTTKKEDLSVAELKKTDNSDTSERITDSGTESSGDKRYESKVETTYYKVRKGDTWSLVAKRNSASISDIKKWNNIKNNKLIAGKTLKIQKTIQVEIVQEIEPKLPEPQLPIVEIDSDYTADLINDYLKKLDRDESTLPLIQIGQNEEEENIHERKAEENTRIIYHKVRIGETITQIAAHYNVSKQDIVAWNKLSSSTAKVGQRLLIKLPTDSNEGQTSQNSNVADQHKPSSANS